MFRGGGGGWSPAKPSGGEPEKHISQDVRNPGFWDFQKTHKFPLQSLSHDHFYLAIIFVWRYFLFGAYFCLAPIWFSTYSVGRLFWLDTSRQSEGTTSR